jgi:hypothetical protein
MPIQRTDHLTVQPVGVEILLYDETTHKAFCLNDLAATVWAACDGSHTVSAIAAAATQALQRPVREDLVLFTLAELRKDGLLLPDDSPIDVPTPSRRDLVRKLGAGAIILLPIVAAIMTPTAAQAYTGCFDC